MQWARQIRYFHNTEDVWEIFLMYLAVPITSNSMRFFPEMALALVFTDRLSIWHLGDECDTLKHQMTNNYNMILKELSGPLWITGSSFYFVVYVLICHQTADCHLYTNTKDNIHRCTLNITCNKWNNIITHRSKFLWPGLNVNMLSPEEWVQVFFSVLYLNKYFIYSLFI